MLCAKHNDDITKDKDKEQFGLIWLCKFSIWDSSTVNDLMLKQEVQDEYHERKANPVSKAVDAKVFFATNPTVEEIQVWLKSLKK